MIFAHLILAHGQADQLHLLVEGLLSGHADDRVVVHIDAGSPLATQSAQFPARHGPQLRLVERPVAVRWGHHSLVEATGRLLDTALAMPGEPFTTAHLLSGSDWPIAPRNAVAAELAGTHPCFIEAEPGVQEERMDRWWLHDRWLGDVSQLSASAGLARGAARRAGAVLDRAVHRSRSVGRWHKGSQWWSLPHDACRVVAAELASLERAGRLRFTACADEHVIQTIVRHHFPDRIAPPRRFIDWSEESSSPRILTRADVPVMRASDAWFARKLDMSVDPFFLDLPTALA